MVQVSFDECCKKIQSLPRLVWGMFTFNLFLFWMILYVIPHRQPISIEENSLHQFQEYMPGVALVLALFSIFFRRYVTSPSFLKKISTQYVLEVDESNQGSDVGLSPDQRYFLRFYPKTLVWLIVCLTINELIAIVGLVHAYVRGDPLTIAPYLALALILNLTCIPDVKRTHQTFRALTRY